jgi:serine/threonine protein kinase
MEPSEDNSGDGRRLLWLGARGDSPDNPAPPVPFVAPVTPENANDHTEGPLSLRDDMTPELWERVQDLFDRMLESSDPQATLAEESDAEVRDLAAELWDNHVRASSDGFLDQPITLVRNLSGDSAPRFSEGRILNSRFAIERLLGQGGMGEVYLAFDQRLGARVAIKTIRPHLADDAAVRARFLAEVRNARQVTHPCVCRIFDLFEEGDVPFFSMEYVDGVRLSDWLEEPHPVRRVARRIARELAEGLHTAHVRGILHCDFKPANVLLAGDPANPRPVITDFGLARAQFTPSGPNVHSLQGGTRDYMAPELLAGGAATVASDVFAYGKVLAQLLPGNRWSTACCAARPEDRPKSLQPVVESLSEGLSRRTLVASATVATGLAAIGAYGWLTKPQFALSPHQRLVINGLRSQDEAKARSLRSLLVAALRQSPLVNIVTDDRLRATLAKLKLARSLPVDRSQQEAVAGSVGGALFLEGTLEPLAQALVLTLEVFLPGQSRAELRISERVDDARNLVRLADRAALHLRKQFGESALSLKGAYRPLEQVISGSPEAVDYYLKGVALYEKADAEGAITCFGQAVQLDPNFALAHLEMGTANLAIYRGTTAMGHFEKAFALRDRVTERDRLWIESRYYNASTDFVSSLAVSRKLAELFPEEPVFQRAAAFAFARTGRPKDALAFNERAVELDSTSDNNWSELLVNTSDAGLCSKVLELYDLALQQGHRAKLLNWGAGTACMGLGDYDKAYRHFEDMADGGGPEMERRSRLLRCGPLIMQGQFDRAAALLDSDLAYDAATGEQERSQTRRSWLGMLEFLGDAPAKARLQAQELAVGDPLPVAIQQTCEGGLLAILLRDQGLVSQFLARLREIEKRWPSSHSSGAAACLEGALKGLRKDPEADASFRKAVGLWSDPITTLMAGQWYAEQGNHAAALDHLNSFQNQQMRVFRLYFSGLVVLAWIEQARCLARLSLLDEALRAYGRVLDHWGDRAQRFSLVRRVQFEHDQLKIQHPSKEN